MFTQKYNITEEQFDKLVSIAKQETGLDIQGRVGRASASGITVSWVFMGCELTLTCEGKPFFVPEKMIVNKFNELVQKLS